ncbi:AraC family transcriptional regulator [Cytobacillus horneckiae]|uniref:AraC family transcriptional regulator n=2 Tax=Cytobacillus horneckiae TaxID=549687 RepID=A0A2N0ZHU8_9BACI|nr:AraC family transcriptional regulator [Cytobacillus horneckiae]MBN6886959.1 AraC family transcriptional regulator [Cytobacillus horneckiae]MCM3177571.1 AraC family transcriptional regulator [Cytobacillus horneckiae]MEC1157874.1 AraC family transcriptional regulator [Cytobacillus horneckiae]MED2937201.1 AraC family transcriptional regulator [Cytobacillus horneckiae]PKG29066.1 AraC family transcriptional regulator [Cytobacillus horneckiae]
MELLSHMNRAMQYIEEHLTEEIEYKEVAKIALCSEYHFKRMFSFLAGMTLSEYIRKRRLTLAAVEILSTSNRIIDISLKYQYSSPDSFTRAFQLLHGFTPTDVRVKRPSLKAFPPMTFQLTIKGGIEMNYRIIDKEPFKIVGIGKRVPIQFEGVNPEINKMWQALKAEDIHYLKGLSNIEPTGLVSASTDFSEGRMEEKGDLYHMIGVATTEDSPSHYDCLEIPALTWAVFESVGPFPQTLQHTWGRIYSEWFPSTTYEQVDGPEILWNESKDLTSATFRSELWIPVKK